MNMLIFGRPKTIIFIFIFWWLVIQNSSLIRKIFQENFIVQWLKILVQLVRSSYGTNLFPLNLDHHGPSRTTFIKNIRLKEFGAKASWQFRVTSFAWIFIWKNYAYGRKTKFGLKYGKIKYGRILMKF